MPTFDEIWQKIREGLSEGMEVPNWSRDTGYTGKSSHIERLNYDEIVFRGERTTQPRHVSKSDFKKVFEMWDRYNRTLVSRADILAISRNSTYILSVLHMLDQLDL